MTRARSSSSPPALHARLLAWFDRFGRKDLPWQTNPTPYRVWVSEIMLQQTQVATVIPYYLRFIERFPDVDALACATLDEVLHLWTGLGYYARARNLHRAARIVCEHYHSELPRDINLLMQLPGIGRSTAGALLALAHGERHAILDGNVKRVLARFHAIEGWPGAPLMEKKLWALAETHLPATRLRDYTQAFMDLGATLCTRTQPACSRCPLTGDCAAHAAGRVMNFPAPQPRAAKPVRKITFVLLRNRAGAVRLMQRPPAGIWGRLWSFPECTHRTERKIQRWCESELGFIVAQVERHDPLRHTFSHFHLDILPVVAEVTGRRPAVMETCPAVWYNITQPDARGLAAPVKRLLLELAKHPARKIHDANGELRKTGPRGRSPQAPAVSGRARQTDF
ncbi:MAG: A/G-specific adenine glycosylase [Gammaproteobacteria bacterium]|nr:A/G-specific adenine glycosylase [Gammaproteobacteria bacterium]